MEFRERWVDPGSDAEPCVPLCLSPPGSGDMDGLPKVRGLAQAQLGCGAAAQGSWRRWWGLDWSPALTAAAPRAPLAPWPA